MKGISLLAIFISSFFICGCTNDEAKQLQSTFNEEIKVETQYKRGKKAKVAAAQYAEMEHNLNNKFVTSVSLEYSLQISSQFTLELLPCPLFLISKIK